MTDLFENWKAGNSRTDEIKSLAPETEAEYLLRSSLRQTGLHVIEGKYKRCKENGTCAPCANGNPITPKALVEVANAKENFVLELAQTAVAQLQVLAKSYDLTKWTVFFSRKGVGKETSYSVKIGQQVPEALLKKIESFPAIDLEAVFRRATGQGTVVPFQGAAPTQVAVPEASAPVSSWTTSSGEDDDSVKLFG